MLTISKSVLNEGAYENWIKKVEKFRKVRKFQIDFPYTPLSHNNSSNR